MPRSGDDSRRMARRALCLAVLAQVAGCDAGRGGSCLLASQNAALSVSLFFGRAIPGEGSLQQAEWEDFASTDIAPRFPDGFTLFDGSGAWRDPATGRMSSEVTKIVQAIVPRDRAGLAEQVAAVASAYRRRFHQQADGVVTSPVCAEF